MADATSTSAAAASPTQTDSGSKSNTPGNSPLLFFVALGFGVVFTNLWYACRCVNVATLYVLT